MNKSTLRKLILINSTTKPTNLIKSPSSPSSNPSPSPLVNTSSINLPIPNQPKAITTNTNISNNISSSSQLFEDSYKELFSSRNKSLSKAFVFNTKLLSKDIFASKVCHVMEQYKYDCLDKDDTKDDVSFLFPKISRNKYIEDKEQIAKILKQSHRLSKSLSSPYMKLDDDEQQRRIKFDFLQEHFKNPMQAYYLVQKNKVIYQSMIQNYQNFEKDMYTRSFNKLNPLLQKTFELEQTKCVKSQPKVKISTKIPKMVDSSLFNSSTLTQRNIKRKSTFHNKRSSRSSGTKLSHVLNGNTSIIPSITLTVRFIQPLKDFPESREQFIFTQQGSDCVMCGGLVSNTTKNIVWEFNFNKLSWQKPTTLTVGPEARFGHSGIIHNKRLIIFGGKYLTLSLLGDVDVYNIETKTWFTPSLSTYSKLKLRRNHIACLVGNQMFVHGGIDEDGTFLNDCYLLNLNPLKWVLCQINEETPSPVLAYHKCCLVLPEEIKINPKMNIYRYPDMGVKHLMMDNIKERGIYVFGGKHSADGKALDDLYILRTGRRPLEWAKVITKGIGPSPRYACSLSYYEEGNCLVVHGGRNDSLCEDFALNDTYILELFSLSWMRVDYCYDRNNMRVSNRCSHETVIYHHKLIIFGGMNSDKYIGSHLCIIDLSSGNKEDKDSNSNIINSSNKHVNNKLKHQV